MEYHEQHSLVPQDWLVQAWLKIAKERGVLPPTATEDVLMHDKEGLAFLMRLGLGFQTPCSSVDTMTKRYHGTGCHQQFNQCVCAGSMPTRVFSLHPHAFCVTGAQQDAHGASAAQVCVTARMAQALESGKTLPTPNGLCFDRARTCERMMGEVWHEWDDQDQYHLCLSEDVQPGARCTVCVDETQATHVCDDCMEALCATCLKFHRKWGLTLRHKRVREIQVETGVKKQNPGWTSVEAL
tara:strand:- start:81 stop:800 length:720 start_codon:yes stop_codon:yes gene_type:complete